jgi:membrane associated rhomboid family serine protease
MWTLALFGPAIEDRLGQVRFLIFYLICGVAGLGHARGLRDELKHPCSRCVESIAGVLGAYTLMFPFSRVIVFVPILFQPLFFSLPPCVHRLMVLHPTVLGRQADAHCGTGVGAHRPG